jgi:hypothetical protein
MTTLYNAFKNRDANNLRNALAVAESNRTADLNIGTEFANRLNNTQTELLNEASTALQAESSNNQIDFNEREILRNYVENPSNGKNFFEAANLLKGKEGTIRILNDMGYVPAASGNNTLAIGDYAIDQDNFTPTFISRDYEQGQVVTAPFTVGGEKYSAGGEERDVPVNSFYDSLGSYISNINSYVGRTNFGSNPGQNLATSFPTSTPNMDVANASPLIQSILSGEKTTLTEQELKTAQADPYVQQLIKDQTAVTEPGQTGSFNPDPEVGAQSRANIESTFTKKRVKPSELKTETMRRAPLIELGDSVNAKINEIGSGSLSEEARNFYKKVGVLRETQKGRDVVKNPTKNAGDFYRESPFINALSASTVYQNEFNANPQAFAEKYANDTEFLKLTPNKKTQTDNKVAAVKGFKTDQDLITFLNKNTDANTGVMAVGYLSPKARYNIAYAAQQAAKKDGLLNSNAFQDSLIGLIDTGVFNTGSAAGMSEEDYISIRDNIRGQDFYTGLSDTVNTIFATSFSADDIEDNLKGNSEYRKLQYDLYQFAELASDSEFDVIAPLMARTMTLNAVSRSSSKWAGVWRDIFGPTAGVYNPDSTRVDFTVFYKAPNGESRPIESLAELRQVQRGELPLDKIHLLQNGNKVGRELNKNDFTNTELLAAMARSVQLAKEQN